MAAPQRITDRDWRRFAGTLFLSIVALFAAYLGLAALVDPYDTGRSTLLSRSAVRPQGPRTASAVRGRDPTYSGAVIGNSHIQLIEPAALSRLTGIPFVQLSVPATGPSEQFALLGWYLQHHERPAAIVLSADAFWCADDPAFPSEHGFPYWLLGEWPTYLRGLLRFTAAQETINRVGWLLNRHHSAIISARVSASIPPRRPRWSGRSGPNLSRITAAPSRSRNGCGPNSGASPRRPRWYSSSRPSMPAPSLRPAACGAPRKRPAGRRCAPCWRPTG
jgi:hypothetical protein